jgi:hypothetical protein
MGKNQVKICRAVLNNSKSLAITISLLCGLPVMFTPYVGDEIWAIYLFGSQYLNDPTLLLERPIKEIPVWLNAGNFRPLGRLFEHLGYLIPMLLTSLTNVTPEFWYSLNRLLLWVLFQFCIFLFCKNFFKKNSEEGNIAALICVIVSNSISLVNSQSGGLRLFPTFYTTSAIVIILSLNYIMQSTAKIAKGTKTNFIKIFIGIVAASYNELTNIIIPVSLILIYMSVQNKNTLHRIVESFREFTYVAIPFLVIWLPTRIYISKFCSVNECYEPSDLTYNSLFGGTVLRRFTSSIPPLPFLTSREWLNQNGASLQLKLFSLLSMICITLILSLLVGALLNLHSFSEKPNLNKLGIVGFSSLSITAVAVSLSSELQKQDIFGVSWRETPLYIFSISLLAVYLLFKTLSHSKYYLLIKKIYGAIFVIFFSAMFFLTLLANAQLTSLYQLEPRAKLSKLIESELVSSSATPSEKEQICLKLFDKNLFSENISLTLQQGINEYTKFKSDELFCVSNS